MLDTPGCWAREVIGAVFDGVFCGVLEVGAVSAGRVKKKKKRNRVKEGKFAYGALRSTGTFLNGAAIFHVDGLMGCSWMRTMDADDGCRNRLGEGRR